MPGNLWAKLERPEYVGENRCLPCTIVNVLIAVALSSALWVIGVRVGAAALGTAAGAGAFVLSLSAIYLRGYLVPGTPVLTKRYFPAWLLRPFGKAPPTPGVTPDAGADAGPERTLVAAGALGAGAGSDLSLTDDVREEWTRAIERIEGIDSGELSAAFATDGYVETHTIGDAFRVHVDGPMVGKWPSRAAFLADLGSVAVLSDRIDGWDDRPVEEKAWLLLRLRRAIETCPECDGATELGTETVQGCCSTVEATTVSCVDCGARLYVETCPECGDTTELGTEPVDPSGDAPTIATTSCVDCGERVFAIPSSLSPP